MAKLDVPAVSIAAARNVPMEMRDGTVLRADIYRTSAADSQPVLLIRNPYGEPMVRTAPVLPAIEAGFAVVVQHCRGTGASDQFAAACAPPVPGLAALRDMPAVSRILPSWRAWLDHEERDDYWDALSYRDTRDRVAAPALHAGGWFDLFLGGTLGNFTTLSKYAATDLEVTGPVSVTLHAATSAADTDFTAKLIATSQVFKAGHRLRVDVASSNFPCYDRNPGNGAPAATATLADFTVAEQTIYLDAARPSYITLPVIPR